MRGEGPIIYMEILGGITEVIVLLAEAATEILSKFVFDYVWFFRWCRHDGVCMNNRPMLAFQEPQAAAHFVLSPGSK